MQLHIFGQKEWLDQWLYQTGELQNLLYTFLSIGGVAKYGVFLIGDLFWCALCLWLFVDLLHQIFFWTMVYTISWFKSQQGAGVILPETIGEVFIFAHNAFTYILISYSTLSMVKVKPKTWSLIRIIDQALMCCSIQLETSWYKCKERLDTC